MSTVTPSTPDRVSSAAEALDRMPLDDFVAAWRLLTGEPPAVILTSRSDMIALLVESVPTAPLVINSASVS